MLNRYKEAAKPCPEYQLLECTKRALELASADVERLVKALQSCRNRMVDDGYHSDEVEDANEALAPFEGEEMGS